MKVVVQSGSRHSLSRRDAEAVLASLPRSWGAQVDKIVLVHGERLEASFHRKEQVLALHCPWEPSSQRNKATVVAVLVQALADASGTKLPDGLVARCQEAVSVSREDSQP
ncbi:MAG: hypothetical protein J0L88_07220 [Xanthomonadales bacterium]|nr:hypothetical protein [Xanthomonadales bacterium]